MLGIYFFGIGTVIGSFLNVLIDRMPRNESIMGRSHCDHCRKKLRWYDLIPIVSYLSLFGRCRYCRTSISIQYPVIEAVTGIIFFLTYKYSVTPFADFRSGLEFISLLAIVSCYIVITSTDIKFHLISDAILLALVVFTFIHNLSTPAELPNNVFSALVVGLPIFLIYYFSRERAMGLGDVLLTSANGFLLGWRDGYLALYIAFVTGAIFGILMLVLHKRKMRGKLPFGPFLVLGAVLMHFWGSGIYKYFMNIFGFA